MRNSVLCSWILLALSRAVGAQPHEDPFAANVRPTEPLAPEDERRSFLLPPGFEVQLVAAEPDILKPLNMAFDERGRLWVTMTQEYPYPAPPDREGRDLIKVLEDLDGDGRSDRITTFADGLNIPIGIHPYGRGAIAFSIPHIWRLEDTDGDGRADRRERLYGPMGWERDTHGLNNAFRRGHDGWLYACHGFNNDTRVRGADGHEVHLHSGNTYRMRLDGSRIEQFTWGQVNPFGMCLDPLGNLFSADCHSKPLYQLLRGGYYPSFGKPHDGLGFAPEMMEHLHSSTGIAGVAVYADENFPPEFRGNAFTGNVMTSRVNRDRLVYHGSTVRAEEAPDFVVTTDPWFRPVDLLVGPDGALYVADFYNRIIGHYEVPLDHPGRDRHRGRIWRIAYTGADPACRPARMPPPLADAPPELLAGAFSHSSLTYRLLALHALTDRFGRDALDLARQSFHTSPSPWARNLALWALHRLGGIDDGILARAAGDEDRIVRVHAMKVLAETAEWSEACFLLARRALGDEYAFVQRAAADALGRHPHGDNVRPLLDLWQRAPASDDHLVHTVRMALRDQLRPSGALSRLVEEGLDAGDASRLAEVSLGLATPDAGAFLVRHLERSSTQGDSSMRLLEHAARHAPLEEVGALSRISRERLRSDRERQQEILDSVLKGIEARGAAVPEELRSWAEEIASSILKDAGSAEPAWRPLPLAGASQRESPWALQKRLCADDGEERSLISSHPRGERLTGVLRSRTFAAPARLRFFLAGHDGFPGLLAQGRNFVQLVSADDGVVLARAAPPRNDIAQPVDWDLGPHADKSVYIEIVDGDDGLAFAWLAVGRFEPEVVPAPDVDPGAGDAKVVAACGLAAKVGLRALQPQILDVLRSAAADLAAREAAARALAAFEPQKSVLGALAPVFGEASLGEEIRGRTARAFDAPSDAVRREILVEALRSAPRRLQDAMAMALASNTEGAELLLTLINAGHASARLLLRPRLAERLRAAGIERAGERIERLTADLPSENEALGRLLDARRKGYAAAQASPARGAVVFERHCANCHQVAGKGSLIAPQLDGASARGLERLLEDVIDPNRNVDVAFRTTTLVLKDGQVASGLLRREEGVTLVLADAKGQEFRVPKDSVAREERSVLSLMPESLVEAVPEAEFYDLAAFLLGQRAVKPEDSKRD